MDSVRIPQDDIQKQEIDLNKKWLYGDVCTTSPALSKICSMLPH